MLETKLNVRALKGAPLSIVIVLMIQQRSVSHALLCQETGYSGNTVTQALEYLVGQQIVSRSGHSGFMLTGENYQLPLYWDEKIEPVSSPVQSVLPSAVPEPQEPCGYCPEIAKITSLEHEITDLKSRVNCLEDLLNRKNCESKRAEIVENDQKFVDNHQEIAENTIEIVNSAPLINESINTDTDNNHESSLIDSDRSAIIADYKNSLTGYGRGIEFSDTQLQELAKLATSADMLEFVLPRAASFESAKRWVKLNLRLAKFHYLKRIGVKDPALSNIINNSNISLFLIDHHYWHWFLLERIENPALQLGWVVRKILDQYDRTAAESAGPLQVAFLD